MNEFHHFSEFVEAAKHDYGEQCYKGPHIYK